MRFSRTPLTGVFTVGVQSARASPGRPRARWRWRLPGPGDAGYQAANTQC